MNNIKFRKEHIRYSKRWYEDVYHSADIYYLPYRSYKEVMSDKQWEVDELIESFAKFDIPEDAKINWLEVACSHGKTPFSLAIKYKNAHFHMFDFSRVAIEWCIKYNPFPDRITIWQGDVKNISYNGNRYDAFFDIITCLDVTEHLPRKVYIMAIKEIHRVCKPGGLLILKQGIGKLREHISILGDQELVGDFEKRGFKKIDELPNRYHVLKRIY